MALKPIKISNFKGGLNLNEDSTIEDNQLSIATNVYYDQQKRLAIRRGQDNFGDQISDSVVAVNTCDATTNWAASDDAANVAGGTAIRGTASVEFDVDVSASANNYATLTNASLGTVDCSAANGFLKFWLYVPAAFNTDLTAVKVRLGSDSSNYHEWTLGTLTEASNNLIVLDFDDASDTGTPDDSSVDYFRLQITYAAGYTDKLNLLIDWIHCYSNTYTEKVHSLKFWEDSTGTRRLIAGCGTSILQYNEDESTWEVIKTGLTTGLKADIEAYTDVLYYTNGTDNYLGYDGTAVTEYSGGDTKNGKYLIVANDIGYTAGVTGALSTLYYSAAAPANMQDFGNAIEIDADNGQNITGLANLGPIIICFKEGSIYNVNVATPERNQLDYSGGCQSNRSIARVENDVFFLDKNGVYSLAQREGTTGSLRAEPRTADLQPLIDDLRNMNISAGIYWEKTNQYYLSVDENNNSFNDSILVYDVLTKAWTRYVGINATDFTIYVDSDGVEHLLYASEYSGRVVEMETGFDDNGVEVAAEIGTKDFDFDEPSLSKEYREHDIVGFISESAEVEVTVEIDGGEAVSATINGSSFTDASDSITLGVHPMGIYPFTGGDIVNGEITLNAFRFRIPVYQTGVRTKIKFTSSKKNTEFILSKIMITPEPQPFDFFANAEIA
jgi:hypothetical protein